jgi:acetyl esterase/lipase
MTRLGAVTPRRVLLLALVCSCATFERHAARARVDTIPDQVYVDGSANPKHRLDLYFPKDHPSFPVVVFIHGGYWRAGDRNYYSALTGLYGTIGLSLAKRGIGVAVVSYRLVPEVPIDGELSDVAMAVHFTLNAARARGGDAARVFLMGHSAGGHLALLLGFDDRWLRAAGVDPGLVAGVVALSPVVDIMDMQEKNDRAFNADITDRVFGLGRSSFASFSPITYIHVSEPPALILLGEHDYPYLAAQVHLAAKRMEAIGASVQLEELPGYTHEDMVRKVGDDDDAVSGRAAEFIERVAHAMSTATPSP